MANDPRLEPARARWAEAVKQHPANMAAYKKNLAEWESGSAAAKKAGKKFTKRKPALPYGPGSHQAISRLYNGMIQPLVPYTLRGVIWYQGEHNASRHTEYRDLFQALITSWREAFQQDFSFYWVQLAAFKAKGSQKTEYARLREAQDQALVLPKTGQALAIDIGEEGNIHPKNKQEAGRRLALIALAKDYGKNVNPEGPRFEKMTIQGNTVRIELKNAAGLHTRGNAPVAAFELAGADKVFHPASVVMEGGTLVVTSPKVAKPVAARHAFRNYPKPEANLYNADELPLSPFRTDDWPEE